jgi:predicted RND superfamily exporter protein
MASDLKYMDQNFYGSRPFEMVLRIKNNQPGFYDTAMMHKVEDIQNYLRDSLRVGALISPNSLFKGANKAFHGGSSNYFRIPDSAHHIQRFAEAIMQTEYADELQRYMVADGSSIRISGRLEDVGTEQFHILSEKLQKFYARNYSQHFSYQITGTAVIYDKISVFLVKILAIAFILAIGIYILFVLIFGQTGRNKNHF